MTPELLALLRGPVAHAADTLDWIESRHGPLPPDGYARIETTVSTVRRLAQLLEQEAAS